jgi:signal transduction histidine kinase/CheY-like chemotaxis protein
LEASDFAQFLAQHREPIVSRFAAEVARKDLPARALARSLLVDHIPKFIDEIVAELRRLYVVRVTNDAIDTSDAAREHGEQRWNLGYDLETLIREYGVLRHCILAHAEAVGITPSIGEFDVLAKCLSVGVAEAAAAYIGFRDEQFRAEHANLEFLAEAGALLSSSLDYRSTLSRLTGLVVPRLADFCVVDIEGTDAQQIPIAHVDPAKVDQVRTLVRDFRPPASSPHGARRALETGQGQLVREVREGLFEAMAQSPEHLALLRKLHPRSWMIVPLRVQHSAFGSIALVYSDSDRRYDERDLTLATDLARRAAVAIDNARLYELTQRERSRVEAATVAKDEFVAMVSEELRSPLDVILGWVRLIRGGAMNESKREHALEVIERNASAQNRLVADLVDISRAITGKIRLHPTQVDLANVVELSIEGVRPALDAKRITVETDIDRTGALMRGDGDRLQQLVWNLLANAVKFTPKNGKVNVLLRRVASDLELVVIDTGRGIAGPLLPQVFEIHRPSDPDGSKYGGGLGIGLSIAKRIVELHGGSIEAQSAGLGRGSTFVVRLPISPLVSTTVGVTRVPATKEPAVQVPVAGGPQGIRVLVVDDETDARELLTFLLEGAGMEVRTASSVIEAMKVLQEHPADVLVSDIGMPDDDGYSLIRQVRTAMVSDIKEVPAIALTAFASNEDRTRALLAGFNLHLAKPVEPAALVRAVRELATPAAAKR